MTRAGADVDRASKPEKTRAQVTDDSKSLDLSMHHPSDGVDTSVRAQKCQNVLGMCLDARLLRRYNGAQYESQPPDSNMILWHGTAQHHMIHT